MRTLIDTGLVRIFHVWPSMVSRVVGIRLVGGKGAAGGQRTVLKLGECGMMGCRTQVRGSLDFDAA